MPSAALQNERRVGSSNACQWAPHAEWESPDASLWKKEREAAAKLLINESKRCIQSTCIPSKLNRLVKPSTQHEKTYVHTYASMLHHGWQKTQEHSFVNLKTRLNEITANDVIFVDKLIIRMPHAAAAACSGIRSTYPVTPAPSTRTRLRLMMSTTKQSWTQKKNRQTSNNRLKKETQKATPLTNSMPDLRSVQHAKRAGTKQRFIMLNIRIIKRKRYFSKQKFNAFKRQNCWLKPATTACEAGGHLCQVRRENVTDWSCISYELLKTNTNIIGKCIIRKINAWIPLQRSTSVCMRHPCMWSAQCAVERGIKKNHLLKHNIISSIWTFNEIELYGKSSKEGSLSSRSAPHTPVFRQ